MKVWAARAAAVSWCAVIFLLSAQADPPVPGFFDFIPYWDKIAHAGLYAVMCVLWRAGFFRGGSAGDRAAAVGWCALYGVSDEFHQRFVPGRSPDALDLAADITGAALATFILWLRERKLSHIRQQNF